MVRWCIRLTHLTLVCEVIRYRFQVWQNLKKFCLKESIVIVSSRGWREGKETSSPPFTRYLILSLKSQKKRLRVGGPQSPFSIASSFILSFVFLPFFLNTKIVMYSLLSFVQERLTTLSAGLHLSLWTTSFWITADKTPMILLVIGFWLTAMFQPHRRITQWAYHKAHTNSECKEMSGLQAGTRHSVFLIGFLVSLSSVELWIEETNVF